jgi:hypothetical protein
MKVREIRYAPPPKKSDAHSKNAASQLQFFLDKLVSCRTQIMVHASSADAFLRFIAPINFGDVKPQGFVMPFKVLV